MSADLCVASINGYSTCEIDKSSPEWKPSAENGNIGNSSAETLTFRLNKWTGLRCFTARSIKIIPSSSLPGGCWGPHHEVEHRNSRCEGHDKEGLLPGLSGRGRLHRFGFCPGFLQNLPAHCPELGDLSRHGHRCWHVFPGWGQGIVRQPIRGARGAENVLWSRWRVVGSYRRMSLQTGIWRAGRRV